MSAPPNGERPGTPLLEVHDLVVHGKGTRPLAPGQTQVLHIPDVAAGEYRMWCDVPGHAQAGQVGTLVVKAATNETAASS